MPCVHVGSCICERGRVWWGYTPAFNPFVIPLCFLHTHTHTYIYAHPLPYPQMHAHSHVHACVHTHTNLHCVGGEAGRGCSQGTSGRGRVYSTQRQNGLAFKKRGKLEMSGSGESSGKKQRVGTEATSQEKERSWRVFVFVQSAAILSLECHSNWLHFSRRPLQTPLTHCKLLHAHTLHISCMTLTA